MVEKSIKEGVYNCIFGFTKANKKYMKNYDENKKSSYLQYWDVSSLYGWEMQQKLPANNFEWIKDTS